MPGYSDLVIEHFQNPRNSGVLERPDGEASTANPVCGDRMRVMIRVADGRIADIRWQTQGCPPAIATSSFASELVRGWPVERAARLSREELAEGIGGLPAAKIHCSVLAADAIRLAVEDYLRQTRGGGSGDAG